MYDGHSIGVVIPAYNEERFVTGVIETIPEFVDKVYVVDDCSTDETWTRIQEAASQRTEASPVQIDSDRQIPVADGSGLSLSASERISSSRIVPIRHTSNRGRGAAVKTGYRRAMADDLDVVAVMDADGQMDPDNLDRLVDPIVNGEAEYAKGNRLVNRAHCQEMSGFRLCGNVLLTGLTKIASGHWGMRDPQNGYTAISRTALEQLSISDMYDRYGFLNDVLVRLGAHELDVADVPMQAIYGDESSGIGYRSFVPQLSFLLLQGFYWRLWMTNVDENALDG